MTSSAIKPKPVSMLGGLLSATGLVVLGFLAMPYYQLTVNWPPGSAQLDNEQANAVFGRLHKNMFRAFDYRDESSIYDALATSIDGPMLEDTYLKIRKSLEMQEQGGAVSRIDEVQVVEGEKIAAPNLKGPDFGYRCRWNLIGTVEHWGHIHQRTNRYDAVFDVELVDDSWKITDMQITNEEPGQVKTSLRTF